MSELDRVWERLQDRAELHARAGILVSIADARRIVGYLCAEFAQLPADETVAHLAAELERLTRQATDRLQRRRKSIRGTC